MFVFGSTLPVRLPASHYTPTHLENLLTPAFSATSHFWFFSSKELPLTPFFSIELHNSLSLFLALAKISLLFSTNSENTPGYTPLYPLPSKVLLEAGYAAPHLSVSKPQTATRAPRLILLSTKKNPRKFRRNSRATETRLSPLSTQPRRSDFVLASLARA